MTVACGDGLAGMYPAVAKKLREAGYEVVAVGCGRPGGGFGRGG